MPAPRRSKLSLYLDLVRFNRPAGCPFHPRCPDAMERCSTAVPSLLPVAPTQLASCFLHHDQAEPP